MLNTCDMNVQITATITIKTYSIIVKWTAPNILLILVRLLRIEIWLLMLIIAIVEETVTFSAVAEAQTACCGWQA